MKKRIIFTLTPIILVFAVFLLKPLLISSAEHMPECVFFKATGFMCPGCGNTRALFSLLSLDFISAIKYNPTIPVLLIFAVVCYWQYVISAWIKPVRLFPKNIVFYMIVLVLLFSYLFVRNFV